MTWIKVTKRLPPLAKIVLVTDGHQCGLGFLGYNATRKTVQEWLRPVNLDPLYNVVAWQNLPKPPKYKNIPSKRLLF